MVPTNKITPLHKLLIFSNAIQIEIQYEVVI